MIYGKEGIKRNPCPLEFQILWLEIAYSYHYPSNGVKAWCIFALCTKENWPCQILNKRTEESGTFTLAQFEQQFPSMAYSVYQRVLTLLMGMASILYDVLSL